MKRDIGLRTVVFLGVLLLCAWSLVPTIMVFSKSSDPHLPLEQREREIYKRAHPKIASKSINLGLDLAGGTHIIVEIDKSKLDESAQRDVMDRSLEIIRNRVDQYGLSEPIITRSGDNRIVADLAGMGAEDARRLIGATALLEFKLVPEAHEFRPVLDRLDAFLAARGQGKPGEAGPARPKSELENVFGRLVEGSDTAADSGAAADSARAAKDTAKTDTTEADSLQIGDDLRNRPFTALLTQVGRDIGVAEANVEKMKRLMADPELRNVIPNRFQFLWGREMETLDDGSKVRRLYMLKRRPEMTGSTIADANFQHVQGGMQAGEIEVGLTFKGLGPKEFARVTGANIGRQLAIVLDSVVYSAPVIQGRIPNGRASITGIGDIVEAKQLAVTLRAGSLPAPMQIVELRSVGPTLGEENIQKGIRAAWLSFLLIVIFMIGYYLWGGVVANVALLVNMVIILAVMSAFHATLTLPGIAGIVLTIGMAVDANVLIFERIREELGAGKSVRSALDAGYKKAFSAIFDSNITTFGTAAVLYVIGVGPIKGFGLTLMIGIAASMFTAIFMTRLIYDSWIERMSPKTLAIGKGLAFLQNINLQTIPRARWYLGVSALVIAAGTFSLGFKGLNLGIDFTGGHVYQVKFEKAPDVGDIRQAIAQAGFPDPRVQTIGTTGQNELLISVAQTGNDSLARAQIQGAVGAGHIVGEESVGPTVGKDLQKAAIWSIMLCLIIIVLYVWFRFGRNGLGFGIAAVLALMHDAFVAVGAFSMMGREVSLTFVAAVLTIIGYSLNDTIVIFDRIRENTLLMGKDSFAARVNASVNQTFSRTIITSGTVFITVTVLAAMGGSSIRDFNLAMIVGVISGVYSTLAVAGPFVVWWDSRRLKTAAAPAKSAAPAKK